MRENIVRDIKTPWGSALGLALCGLLLSVPAVAQEAAPAESLEPDRTAEESAPQPSRLDQVLDAIIANERYLADTLERYRPLVETYLQTVTPDAKLGSVPVTDNYFIGRLELARDVENTPDNKQRKAKKNKKALNLFDEFYSATFKPEGFARMLIVDQGAFDRQHYDFDFVRSEFLGEVRTLVFDVTPKAGEALARMRSGRFTGRIWAEDQGFNIVRFNGIYKSELTLAFHFDSWRLNMAPNLWLPAYVYTEESDPAIKNSDLTHKGQTRLWGYEIPGSNIEDEFTKVMIDAPQTEDPSDRAGHLSPIENTRSWEGEAEENVLRRLQRAGLVAPEGEVDRVLETVVANLEITNELNIQPPVRCRVLLTTPLESFTIGHTIVISRGLIDVLPDEASLAMVLAHELGHILSRHKLDTRYAFADQMLVGDKQALGFTFDRDAAEEQEADDRAVALLQNSPYKDDLAGAGLFLKILEARSEVLPALIQPHFGNRLATDDKLVRMNAIQAAAPELDPSSIDQTSALPLGGRVKLDPWNARIELMKSAAVPLLSAREKMPFQVTPLMPYLARYDPQSTSLTDAVAREKAATAADQPRSEVEARSNR